MWLFSSVKNKKLPIQFWRETPSKFAYSLRVLRSTMVMVCKLALQARSREVEDPKNW